VLRAHVVAVVRTEASITSGDDLVKALRSSRPPSIAIAPGFGSSSHIAVLKLKRRWRPGTAPGR
jgi:hypothetical protein